MSENIPTDSGFDWAAAGLDENNEAIQQNAEQIEAHNIAVMEEAKLVHAVLSEGRGHELLQYLEDCTTEIPLLQVSRTVGGGEINLSTSDWAYYREGQNSIVRMLKAKMKLATMDLEKGKENETTI